MTVWMRLVPARHAASCSLAPATARAAEGDIIVQRAPGRRPRRAARERRRRARRARCRSSAPSSSSPLRARRCRTRSRRCGPTTTSIYAELDRPRRDRARARRHRLRPTSGGCATRARTPASAAGADIDVLDAWERSEGLGVTVAVVDTGINADHEDLAGQLAATPAELGGRARASTTTATATSTTSTAGTSSAGDNVAQDGHGHGTHVSGTIAAAGDNGVGVVGVAPRAKVLAAARARRRRHGLR